MEPRLLPRRSAPSAERDAGRLDRAVGDVIDALDAGRRAAQAETRAPPATAARRSPRTSSDDTVARELVLAADQFIITPAGRVEDAARARAAGDEVRTVIAGYHWFTDWGRDTMISLEGLTLATGRHARGGLHPAHLRALRPRRPDPEHVPGRRDAKGCTTPPTRRCGSSTPSHRYVRRDRRPRRRCAQLLPNLRRHRRSIISQGTRFGIGVDPADGLLRQGAEGYQLTWMDAKVDDWVVTPRRGKAVEINALWYNALCLLEGWLARSRATATALDLAGACRRAPATRSTRGSGTRTAATCTTSSTANGGDDPACRPNQVFAISLDHPVLDRRAGAGAGRRARPAADAGRPALAGAGHPGLQGEVLRRPAGARRGLSPGHGLGLADRPVRRRLAEAAPGRPRRGARARSTASRRTRARRASARSARSSTPSRRTLRAAASPRPGASPRCCGSSRRR